MTMFKRYIVFSLMAALLWMPACAGKSVPVLIGQTSVAVAQSIGQLQVVTKQLTDAKAVPAPVALSVQKGLLQANASVEKVIPILEALDNAIKAGQGADPALIDRALAILQSVSADLSTVLTGVPLSDTTRQVVDLVRAAQTAVTTVLIEVARFKTTPVPITSDLELE